MTSTTIRSALLRSLRDGQPRTARELDLICQRLGYAEESSTAELRKMLTMGLVRRLSRGVYVIVRPALSR